MYQDNHTGDKRKLSASKSIPKDLVEDSFRETIVVNNPHPKFKFIWIGLSPVEWQLMRDIQATLWLPASVITATALVCFSADRKRLAQIQQEGEQSLTIEHLKEFRSCNAGMMKTKIAYTPAIKEVIDSIKQTCPVLKSHERICREAICYFWQILLPHIDAVRQCAGLPELIEEIAYWNGKGLNLAPFDPPKALPDSVCEAAKAERELLKEQIGYSRIQNKGAAREYKNDKRRKADERKRQERRQQKRQQQVREKDNVQSE